MDDNGDIDTSFMNSDERAGWNELLEVIKLENQSPQWNIAPNSPVSQMNNLAQSSSGSALAQHSSGSSMQNMNPNPPTRPFLRIVEQPATKALRFRYECEGRSAGSIPGVHSTPENKTFPTIEIVNYDKDAIVVVSCVTKDSPYRPHPHKVVGRDGGGQKYENGYCNVKLKGPQLRAVFNNLGIQCVKRREVATSLNLRRERKINPFNVPYPSNDQKPTYDLNVVRLCFQGFINPTGERWEPLEPQISDPIFDKKGVFELKICQLCKCSGKATGGDRIILLCEKVDKNDIKIKFSECNNEGEIKWAAYADFQQSDIHKQYAISFKTPRYENINITNSVKVYIQLERPSDGALSVPLEFEFFQDQDRKYKRTRYNDSKEGLYAFQQDMQSKGLMTTDSNGEFNQLPSFNTNRNNFDQSNAFTTPQLKIEPAQSPDYNTLQMSPYSMTHSPIPQPSPTGAGLQYTILQTSTQNTNQFLPETTATTTTATITDNFLQQWNGMKTTSGGSITLINNNQSTIQNTANPFSLPPNIPFQANHNNNPMRIDFDDLELPTELPTLPESEEGLTVSGLVNELYGQQLMEISNLSVSDET